METWDGIRPPTLDEYTAALAALREDERKREEARLLAGRSAVVEYTRPKIVKVGPARVYIRDGERYIRPVHNEVVGHVASDDAGGSHVRVVSVSAYSSSPPGTW